MFTPEVNYLPYSYPFKKENNNKKKNEKIKKVCLVYCEMNCMAYLQYF